MLHKKKRKAVSYAAHGGEASGQCEGALRDNIPMLIDPLEIVYTRAACKFIVRPDGIRGVVELQILGSGECVTCDRQGGEETGYWL